MNEQLMSQFIDNEMDLQEKLEFVESVIDSPSFAREMLVLLNQEQLLHGFPAISPTVPRCRDFSTLQIRRWWRPIGVAAAALLVCGLILLQILPQSPIIPQSKEFRFVLYQPSAQQVSVIGTFTQWSPVPMRAVGSSGYWSLSLSIPPGEHRYSFLLDRDGQVADPTATTWELDDFGGQNSILIMGDGHEPLS